MQLELNLFDPNKSEKEIITRFFAGTSFNINTVFTPVYYAGKIKALLPSINVACAIDYPDGLADTALRQHSCISAIRKGATFIDLVVNPVYITNGRKQDLIDDIRSIKLICDDKNVILRVMLDYRMHQDSLIFHVCSIIRNLGIDYIIPSTGQFVDDVYDNTIICELITNKNPGIKTILNTPYCTKEQYDKISKSLFGIRLKNFDFGV